MVAALFSREEETPSASNKGRLDDQPTAFETRPSTSGVTPNSAPPQDAPSASNKGRLEEQPVVLEDTSGTFNETEEEDRSTS